MEPKLKHGRVLIEGMSGLARLNGLTAGLQQLASGVLNRVQLTGARVHRLR